MGEYVLETGANINTQAGLDYNSALHEAVLLQSWPSVKILFGHGVDDTLINNEGKMAIDYCTDKHSKREFTKAKQFRKKHKEDGFHRVSDDTSAFMLAGMDVNEVSEATLRR